jgi:hypothetical protein
MRSLAGLCLLVGAVLASTPAIAQEGVDTLRQELADMRKQFDRMREQYERAIDRLTERLRAIESQARPAAPATTTVAPAAPATPPPAPPGPGRIATGAEAAPAAAPAPIDLARPREPFALQARGAGQLLFDIGIAGDLVANLVQDNVDQADAGTFAGRENRFFPREIELSFFGQVDPYARAEVRIEAAEEFEDGDRALEVSLAEAHLTLLTLPLDTQLKLGKMRSRFGLLNEHHQHDLPQVDRPNVLVRFFGEEQLVETGGELVWVAPLPVYLQAIVGLFDGDNDVAFGAATLKRPLLTGRLRTFFELGDLGAIQLGASVATGDTDELHRNTVWGADAKWKLIPAGWRHPFLTLAGELLFASRKADVPGEDLDGDGVADTPDTTRRLDRWGWYAYAEVQPWKRWIGGLRFDWTESPTAHGHEWAVEPYVSFMPSEFLRFRLAYKRTERSDRDLVGGADGSGRTADELLFQATFLLGAHPAHPF